jgi:hypothetical protein
LASEIGRKSFELVESCRVDEICGRIANIDIQIQTAIAANFIFAKKSAGGAIVISGAVVLQPGLGVLRMIKSVVSA